MQPTCTARRSYQWRDLFLIIAIIGAVDKRGLVRIHRALMRVFQVIDAIGANELHQSPFSLHQYECVSESGRPLFVVRRR